jgi:hypothetical protein
MHASTYFSRLPAPKGKRAERTRRSAVRSVQAVEAIHSKRLDLRKAEWPALLDRLAGFNESDWAALKRKGFDYLLPLVPPPEPES